MKSNKKIEQFKKAYDVALTIEDFFKNQIEANALTIGDVIYVLGVLCGTALINCTLSGKKTARTYFNFLIKNIVFSYNVMREQYKEEIKENMSYKFQETENNDGINC